MKQFLVYLLLVGIFSLVVQAADPVDAASLWEKYRSELVRFLSRGSVTEANNLRGMQLLQNGVEIPPENFQSILEYAPKWGFLMDYSADKFHSVYRSFLDDLIVNPVDPNLMKQLDPIYMEIEKIQDRLLEVEMACYNRWTSISDAFRSRYNNDFNQFKKAMCTEFVTLETKSKTLAGQIEYMMKNLSDRKTYLATTATNKYSLHFGTKNWVALNSYESFVNNMRAGQTSPFSIKIDQYTSSVTESFYGKTSGFNLIIISYSSMKKEAKLTTNKSEFKMEISGQGFAAIGVTPSKDWFTGDVIQEWRNGPFKSPVSRWFNGGAMSMVPRTLYFVYQPKVTMFLNQEDTERIERESKTSFGISLGFLGFNYGKSSSFKKSVETNNLWKVEIESKSNTPQLIGVAHTIY